MKSILFNRIRKKDISITQKYNLENLFVIGDRLTDVELVKNLNSKAIFVNFDEILVRLKYLQKEQR